nr:toxin-antitoxin system YwqK family antitoxin [Tenuifilaceae bacterium]
MKQFITLSILIFLAINSHAQRLTLNDLTNLCNKKNWEDVNQILLTKNWSYYDSEKGNTLKYNTITWSYNKDYYSNKAQGWFYLYTYEGFPNKISYSIFNKESYTLIQNSLSSNGFKLSKSEIEDNEVISTYSNQNYTLKISTQRRDDDEWTNRSVTAYSITLIKKAGIYDPDNGAKTDYYDDGYSIEAEYTLKNGKLNGAIKAYYQNGNIRKTGYFINGKENGLFKEYNEDGSINIEYNMKDGEMNGAIKNYYENGHVKKTGSFLNGKRNGNFKEYAENGNLEVTYSKINDEYNGLLTIYEAGKVAKKINYKNGARDG